MRLMVLSLMLLLFCRRNIRRLPVSWGCYWMFFIVNCHDCHDCCSLLFIHFSLCSPFVFTRANTVWIACVLHPQPIICSVLSSDKEAGDDKKRRTTRRETKAKTRCNFQSGVHGQTIEEACLHCHAWHDQKYFENQEQNHYDCHVVRLVCIQRSIKTACYLQSREGDMMRLRCVWCIIKGGETNKSQEESSGHLERERERERVLFFWHAFKVRVRSGHQWDLFSCSYQCLLLHFLLSSHSSHYVSFFWTNHASRQTQKWHLHTHTLYYSLWVTVLKSSVSCVSESNGSVFHGLTTT